MIVFFAVPSLGENVDGFKCDDNDKYDNNKENKNRVMTTSRMTTTRMTMKLVEETVIK